MIPRVKPNLLIYFTEPIEYGFFYLIPVFVIIDLIIVVWLIYWFYEYMNKNPQQQLNKLLRIIVILLLISTFLATGGYIIMFANNKSFPAEVGIIFNGLSGLLLIAIVILFVIFLEKRKRLRATTDKQ